MLLTKGWRHRAVKGIITQQNPHFLPSPLHEYSPLLALTELLILGLCLASQQFKNVWTAVFDIAYPKYRLKFLRQHFHLNPGIDLSWDSTYRETLGVIYTKFKAFGTGLRNTYGDPHMLWGYKQHKAADVKEEHTLFLSHLMPCIIRPNISCAAFMSWVSQGPKGLTAHSPASFVRYVPHRGILSPPG